MRILALMFAVNSHSFACVNSDNNDNYNLFSIQINSFNMSNETSNDLSWSRQ